MDNFNWGRFYGLADEEVASGDIATVDNRLGDTTESNPCMSRSNETYDDPDCTFCKSDANDYYAAYEEDDEYEPEDDEYEPEDDEYEPEDDEYEPEDEGNCYTSYEDAYQAGYRDGYTNLMDPSDLPDLTEEDDFDLE